MVNLGEGCGKSTLKKLINTYTIMLDNIMQDLEEQKEHHEEEWYQELYAMGNDVTQMLDDYKLELKKIEDDEEDEFHWRANRLTEPPVSMCGSFSW